MSFHSHMNCTNVSYVQGAKCCGPFVRIQVERRKAQLQGQQMGLEEASGLKEARKERNNIPWAVYDVEK